MILFSALVRKNVDRGDQSERGSHNVCIDGETCHRIQPALSAPRRLIRFSSYERVAINLISTCIYV